MERVRKCLEYNWKSICYVYALCFVKKHKLDETEMFWIGNNPGTILCVSDYFISMDVIRYDIDNDVPEEKFDKWYWKYVENSFEDKRLMNYPTYCKGLEEALKEDKRKLKNAKKSLKSAREIFLAELNKFS